MHSRARGALVCALTLTLALALAPAAVADAAKPKPKPTSVEVMTRNIYLGGNIFGPLAATTREEFERRLTDFVNRSLLKSDEASVVDAETPLFESGVINSLRILDLIAFVRSSPMSWSWSATR